MKPLDDNDTQQLILLAWADSIPFETIKREYGLTENQVRVFMRKNQSAKTYRRWRERLERRSGRSSKHATLSSKTSTRDTL